MGSWDRHARGEVERAIASTGALLEQWDRLSAYLQGGQFEAVERPPFRLDPGASRAAYERYRARFREANRTPGSEP